MICRKNQDTKICLRLPVILIRISIICLFSLQFLVSASFCDSLITNLKLLSPAIGNIEEYKKKSTSKIKGKEEKILCIRYDGEPIDSEYYYVEYGKDTLSGIINRKYFKNGEEILSDNYLAIVHYIAKINEFAFGKKYGYIDIHVIKANRSIWLPPQMQVMNVISSLKLAEKFSLEKLEDEEKKKRKKKINKFLTEKKEKPDCIVVNLYKGESLEELIKETYKEHNFNDKELRFLSSMIMNMNNDINPRKMAGKSTNIILPTIKKLHVESSPIKVKIGDKDYEINSLADIQTINSNIKLTVEYFGGK